MPPPGAVCRMPAWRKGRAAAAMTRMDVAEHVGDRRPVDAGCGSAFDRHDGLDRHAVAGLDDLQRVGGHGRQGGDGGRCGGMAALIAHPRRGNKDEPMTGLAGSVAGIGYLLKLFKCMRTGVAELDAIGLEVVGGLRNR